MRLGPCGVLGGVTLLLAACSDKADVVAPPPPVAVEVADVLAAGGAARLAVSGVLQREREAALAFRIPGVITRLTVDAGDPVARGQVVATIDPTGVQARLAESAAALDKARGDQARDARLVERGFVSGQRVADRESAVRSASAAYDMAAFDARSGRLVSPVSGVVLERRAQAGEVMQAGQAVVVVADASSAFVVRAPVADRLVGQVRPGQTVVVSGAALGTRTLAGTVQQVGQRAGAQTGVVEVEVRVPGDPALRSGMVVRAEIAVGGAAAATAFARVPAEAVLEADGGRGFVYRLSADGKRVTRTAVSFGGFDGDDALVGGLPPGVKVVTSGAGFVRDGQAVQVVAPAQIAAAR